MDATTQSPKVGDILVSSWGYDQTNIDYYQVVGVTKVSVRIRKIDKTVISTNSASDLVTPRIGSFVGEAKTRRVKPTWNGEGYSCSISDYASARLWDGKPSHQTASGCGH